MADLAQAYCAEIDIIGYAQYLADFTAGTTPTEAEVTVMAQGRAGEIYAWIGDVMGSTAVGPADFSTPIDTGTDVGKALANQCRIANAMSAAADALEAAGASDTPSRTERINDLLTSYLAMKENIQALAMTYQASTDSATHFTTGEITSATIVSREEEGLQFNGKTEF